jgi:MFS family permease
MSPVALAKKVFGLLAVDTTPLRESPDYRFLLSAQAISSLGSAITYVVLPWQVYQLTRSSALVGLVGLVEFIPMVVMAFVGGALADRFDRRLLVRLADGGLFLVATALAINATRSVPSVRVIFGLAGVAAAFSAMARPARDSLIPRIIPADRMSAAAALGSLVYSISYVAGPALAGLIVAAAGPAVGFAIDAASYLASVVLVSLIRPIPRAGEIGTIGLGAIADGWRYAVSRQELIGTYLIDMNAMFFGMPMALFPAMAEQLGPGTVGLLYAMPAVGSGLASLTSGWTSRVSRHGRAVAIAAAAWGAGIIGFGLAPSLGIALLSLVVAGAADCVSGIFRMTIWNQTIPNALRGRLAGIEQVSYLSGPYLGNAEAGLVASAFGVRASVVSGGVLCVLGSAVISAWLPRFIGYDARAWRERTR